MGLQSLFKDSLSCSDSQVKLVLPLRHQNMHDFDLTNDISHETTVTDFNYIALEKLFKSLFV